MKTAARRSLLLELLAHNPRATQDELLAKVKTAGFQATQSTLSRDIADLGYFKSKGQYILLSQRSGPLTAAGLLLGSAAGPNLAVLKTEIGAAQRVGLLLDQSSIPGLVGTIAGDDTIFVAFSQQKSLKAFLAEIEGGRA